MTTATVLYERFDEPPWKRKERTEMEAMLLRAGYADPPGLARKLQQEGMGPYELEFRLATGQHVQKASEGELDVSALGESAPAPAKEDTVVVAAAAAVIPDVPAPAKRTRRSKACCTPDIQLAVDPARHAQCQTVAKKLGAIDTPAKAYALIAPYMESCDQEVVVVVLLNVHFRYLGMVEVARGQRARVAVDTTDILRPVLAAGAKSYFFSHCHPSGHAKPSEADRALTKNVEKATKLFHQEITFLDHLVVGKGEYFSIRENKLRKA
ncbi:MAG TPA: JAB domain-containing protein [bacterium]|nr:JAB domain-containing protein [bacterium]